MFMYLAFVTKENKEKTAYTLVLKCKTISIFEAYSRSNKKI